MASTAGVRQQAKQLLMTFAKRRARDQEVEARPKARHLMTHPGVGPQVAPVFHAGTWSLAALS
jgi:hypothetical protein